MKKFIKNHNLPIVICVIAIVLLICAFVGVYIKYTTDAANLSTQQQWQSGKDSFDTAYEIAAADKETPDKTLYVPQLKNQLGKTVDEAVNDMGQGAKVVSSAKVGGENDKVETETTIILTNESGDAKTGSPTVIAGTNHAGIITKISFECNTWALGYGALSFTDLIENNRIVEKTMSEGGLNIDSSSVKVPESRSSYTTYQTDGTTVVTENCTFSGTVYQDKHNYTWSATVFYDYTKANSTGNLADTVRKIKITMES